MYTDEEPLLQVSAPGKVILFGDHSVVYNRKAIASATSLRSTLVYNPGDLQQRFVNVQFLDLGIFHTFSEHILESFYASCQADDTSMDMVLCEAIKLYISELSFEKLHQSAILLFLYLYIKISYHERTIVPGSYRIRSELPIGAGLGSSASISVCLSTILLLRTSQIQSPQQQDVSHHASTLQLINKWAYAGEQCVHGTPSGVDNTVATYGGGVVFSKLDKPIHIEMPIMPFLLVNTGVSRSTHAQVAKVADLRSKLPNVVEPILDALHAIANQAQELVNQKTIDVEKLGQLIVLNQDLLRSLGVSHESIESVIHAHETIGYTKLVGAGGGGCVLTLLRSDSEDVTLREGMSKYKVKLGCAGVGVRAAGSESIEHYQVNSF